MPIRGCIARNREEIWETCIIIIGRLIKNQLDVEECINDTYLGVWFTIPPKTPDNLKAYILKIARNQALKKYEHIHAAKRDIDMCLPYEELSNYLAKAGEEDWENNELKDIVEDFWNRCKNLIDKFCIKILVLYVGKRDYEML